MSGISDLSRGWLRSLPAWAQAFLTARASDIKTLRGTLSLAFASATTLATIWEAKPDDYANGKPLIALLKQPTADKYTLVIDDGNSHHGTLDLVIDTLTKNGVELLTAGALDTDTSLAANSDSKIATQKAVKAYADARIAASDALVYKGVIDCSANPNYPAADCGWTYRVSVAGKIGGASGKVVEAGDIAMCLTDATASGNEATVGANWNVIQTNIDGAVIGPASSTSGNLPTFSSSSGKALQDSGVSIDTDTALTANSNSRLATQAAVRAFVLSGTYTMTNKTLTSPTINGGALSGTFTGNPTFSGAPTVSRGTWASALDYFILKPTDQAAGKPGIYFSTTGSAWNIGLYDTVNNAGTLNFQASTSLTWNGNQLVDVATSQVVTGLKIITRGVASSVYDILVLKPSDWGPGKPGLTFSNDGVAAFSIFPWDGSSGSGTISFGGSVFKASGVAVNTTASGANVNVDPADGTMKRVTSMLAAKRDIEDMDADRALDFVRAFRAVWYRSKCEGDNPSHSWYGAIAEELAEIDPRFVLWQTHETYWDVVDVPFEDEEQFVERHEVTTREVDVLDEDTGRLIKGTIEEQVPVYGMRKVPRLEQKPVQKSRPLEKPIPIGIDYARLSVPLMVANQHLLDHLAEQVEINSTILARLDRLEAKRPNLRS